MGNIRGNKYCREHEELSDDHHDFWAFSLDDVARYDVPAAVDFILQHTSFTSLVYIGFSQGSGQCFAALSLPENRALNQKIRLFIALAPCTTPLGMDGILSRLIRPVMRRYPHFMYALFGQGALIDFAPKFQHVFVRLLKSVLPASWSHLPFALFAKLLDACMWLLFGWKMQNIDIQDKLVLYQHLYSTGSVRGVVVNFIFFTL